MRPEGGVYPKIFQAETPLYNWQIFGGIIAKGFLTDKNHGKIMLMKGIALRFVKKTQTGTDAMGNPVMSKSNIDVSDCLIAPITEPVSAREQQAMEQSKDQVRIHIPKTYTGNLSNSDVVWNGKVFHLDSDSVKFMDENTPGRWNRYFRAESING